MSATVPPEKHKTHRSLFDLPPDALPGEDMREYNQRKRRDAWEVPDVDVPADDVKVRQPSPPSD